MRLQTISVMGPVFLLIIFLMTNGTFAHYFPNRQSDFHIIFVMGNGNFPTF